MNNQDIYYEIVRNIQLGISCKERSELEQSRSYLLTALKLNHNTFGDNILTANILLLLGEVDLEVDSIDSAENHLMTAQEVYLLNGETIPMPQYTILLNALARVSVSKYKFDEAEDYIRKALEVNRKYNKNDNIEIINIYYTQAIITKKRGLFALAQEIIEEKIIKESENLLQIPDDLMLSAWYSLIEIMMVQNKFLQAESYGLKALKLAEEKGNKPAICKIFNSLGIIYKDSRRYNEARSILGKAKTFAEKVFPIPHPFFASVFTHLADLDRLEKKYEEALIKYNLVLKIDIDTNTPPANIATDYTNISVVYRNIEDYQKAFEYQIKALEIDTEVFGNKHYKTSNDLWNLGHIFFAAGNFKQALHFLQDALIANSISFNNSDLKKNPAPSDCFSIGMLLKIMIMKAICLSKIEEPSFKDSAYLNFEECIKVYESIRNTMSFEVDKKNVMCEFTERLFPHAVDLMFELYITTGNLLYKSKAFEYIEKGKSYLLLSMFIDSSAKSLAGIPDNVQDEENKIDASIFNLRNQLLFSLHSKMSDHLIHDLKIQLSEEEARKTSFVNILEEKYSNYFSLKYDLNYEKIDSLQNSLSGQRAIINYFFSMGYVYIAYISHKKYILERKNLPERFNDYIKSFSESIILLENKGLLENSKKLYSILIEPIKDFLESDAVTDLIIIPHEALWNIPWEALIISGGGMDINNNYSETPFLVKKYSISYNYSSTLWGRMNDKKINIQKSPPSGFLGVAPDFSNNNVRIPDKLKNFFQKEYFNMLPFSINQVEEIGKFFQNSLIKTNNQATKEIFIKNIQGKKYIHIATHGFYLNEISELCFLVFNPSDTESHLDDHILYASDTYNLKLSASLLVLSACKSARGEYIKGEGIMSLARGFLHSGVDNIIASLWQVNDKSSKDLFTKVYLNILSDSSFTYAQALQKAKIDLIDSSTYAHPFYWAAFVLMG